MNRMRLSEVLRELSPKITGADLPLPQNAAVSTGNIVSGGIFIAISGNKADGHDFIPQALETCQVIVHSKPLALTASGKTFCQVSDTRKAAALIFRALSGMPDARLKLLGVTGTNGKTTTVCLLRHLFAGRCGMLSTVEYDNGRTVVPATHTTPGPEALFKAFREMADHQLEYAAMELSSHALDQSRAYGCSFTCAIFTNLTGDHLDYHQDMESYYQAKKRFFTELLARDGCAVINIDDAGGERLARELADFSGTLLTFGCRKEAMCRIRDLTCSASGIAFVLETPTGKLLLESTLNGRFNAYNLAGAVLAAWFCGLDERRITERLALPVRVPGRLEKFSRPGGAAFFVDFAHTDDALVNVLDTLRQLRPERLICLFGAGGSRDRSKRPRMGAAAAANADILILTSDNPRDEDPAKIIEDVLSGIPDAEKCCVIPDREQAIRHAVKIARKGDIVLIAGKGHENTQEIRGVKIPFSDAEVLSKLLKDLPLEKKQNGITL